MTTVPLHALTAPGTTDAPVLVLMHGRGSDERDLFPVGRMLHPTAAVVSVRAPFPAAPWGYGTGYAWYRYLGGTTPEPESFAAGQDSLDAFLAQLRIEHADAPIVLGGFSQGGTTALAHALRHPGAVAGVINLSGFLAEHPTVTVTPASVATTPIFWGHGEVDPSIPFATAMAGWTALQDAGAALTAKGYPGMGHTIGSEEVADLKHWLGTLR